jgi:hypothetical protein
MIGQLENLDGEALTQFFYHQAPLATLKDVGTQFRVGVRGKGKKDLLEALPQPLRQAGGCVQHHETLCITVGGEQHV